MSDNNKNFFEEDGKLMVNVSDPTVLPDLLQYIYKTTRIERIVYEGMSYYERSNMWEGDIPNERPDNDPDVECDGYGDCKVEEEIFPEDPDSVKYKLEYDKVYAAQIIENGDLDEWCENTELLIKLATTNTSSENIILTGPNSIILKNRCGINRDHRGSDHCKVKLAFYDTYVVKCPTNLLHFMETCYRVKSHKWDKWYELYCGANVEKVPENCLKVDIIFDHGS